MWWYGPQYSERGHQHDYVMRASVISSSARVLAESAIALAADSPAVSLVKLSARQPKRAPTPACTHGHTLVGKSVSGPACAALREYTASRECTPGARAAPSREQRALRFAIVQDASRSCHNLRTLVDARPRPLHCASGALCGARAKPGAARPRRGARRRAVFAVAQDVFAAARSAAQRLHRRAVPWSTC